VNAIVRLAAEIEFLVKIRTGGRLGNEPDGY
jgi:hypothetical protein